MIVLGIDPGLDGAIAALHRGKVISVVDMPTVEKVSNGKLRRRVSAGGVADIVQRLIDTGTVVAWLEQVSPRSGEGVVSSFSFGRSVGTVEGTLAALGVPVNYVTPQQWMKHMRVPKDGSIGRAIEAAPHMASDLARKKDHGRADAILIALFGDRETLL